MLTAGPVDDFELAGLFCRPVSAGLIVLAVSGGADSIALMHLFSRHLKLAADAAWPNGCQVVVATVDHGLREHSSSEARFVAEQALSHGFEHVTLPWLGTKPSSGLQNAAREARYRLLGELVEQRKITPAVIAVAHHRDDQAETVLMRLARGSGVDGLKGMKREDRMIGCSDNDTMVWRPLLEVPKSRLIATLKRDGIGWIEDCSNENLEFERVRVRKAQTERNTLGLSDSAIVRTARRMERANDALGEIAQRAFDKYVGLNEGAYSELPALVFENEPEEIVLRVVSKAIQDATGASRPANLAKLEALVSEFREVVSTGRGPLSRTLSGCVVTYDGAFSGGVGPSRSPASGRVLFYCEAGRADLSEILLRPGQSRTWSRRFFVHLPESAQTPLTLRALGVEALSDLRRQSDKPIPRRAAVSLPSFWDAGRLIYVPHLDYCVDGWREPLGRVRLLERSGR